MKKNVFFKAGILLLTLLLLPGLSGCRAISSPVATPTPTATPAMPGTVLEVGVPIRIETVSSIVGTGEVSFTPGDEQGSLRANVRGEIPIVDGKSCDFCLATIRIAPNLKVPLPLFSLSDIPPQIPGGTGRTEFYNFVVSTTSSDAIFTEAIGVIIPLPLNRVGASGSVYRSPANTTRIELVLDLAGNAIQNPDSYILAGPSGAILRMEVDTFTLIEGEASIVR